MKTIGLLGGLSWESTLIYYQILNRAAQQRLGGVASAKLLLHSVDFAEYDVLLQVGDWRTIAQRLGAAGRGLRQSGADFLMICTNTMHKVAEEVAEIAGLPLLHICDCTAAAILAAGLRRVGLLGTAYTMEQPFYRARMEAHGLQVLVPGAADRASVQRIIFTELVRGIITPEAGASLRAIIAALVADGAEGIILGCTELPLLIASKDCAVPVFDTVELHAKAASRQALE